MQYRVTNPLSAAVSSLVRLPIACRDKAWSVNRLGRIARLHQQPEACVQIINTLYGFNAMEVQEAFVKARPSRWRRRSKLYPALCSPVACLLRRACASIRRTATCILFCLHSPCAGAGAGKGIPAEA